MEGRLRRLRLRLEHLDGSLFRRRFELGLCRHLLRCSARDGGRRLYQRIELLLPVEIVGGCREQQLRIFRSTGGGVGVVAVEYRRIGGRIGADRRRQRCRACGLVCCGVCRLTSPLLGDPHLRRGSVCKRAAIGC
eukprot:6947149-Pyramimonas_sp.AAC.2